LAPTKKLLQTLFFISLGRSCLTALQLEFFLRYMPYMQKTALLSDKLNSDTLPSLPPQYFLFSPDRFQQQPSNNTPRPHENAIENINLEDSIDRITSKLAYIYFTPPTKIPSPSAVPQSDLDLAESLTKPDLQQSPFNIRNPRTLKSPAHSPLCRSIILDDEIRPCLTKRKLYLPTDSSEALCYFNSENPLIAPSLSSMKESISMRTKATPMSPSKLRAPRTPTITALASVKDVFGDIDHLISPLSPKYDIATLQKKVYSSPTKLKLENSVSGSAFTSSFESLPASKIPRYIPESLRSFDSRLKHTCLNIHSLPRRPAPPSPSISTIRSSSSNHLSQSHNLSDNVSHSLYTSNSAWATPIKSASLRIHPYKHSFLDLCGNRKHQVISDPLSTSSKILKYS
jgi:hypothetical protein